MYAVYLERSGCAADEPRHRQMKTMVDDDGERKRFAHSDPAKQGYRWWGEQAGVALAQPVGFVAIVGPALFAQFLR